MNKQQSFTGTFQSKFLKEEIEGGEKNDIKVVCVTWNLFGGLLPVESLQLVKKTLLGQNNDIIVFGTQQCQRSLCMSFFCESKSLWEDQLKEVFQEYWLASCETLVGLHLAIMVKMEYRDNISVQRKEVLRASFCRLMGQKGAVSIQLNFLGCNFQFINCHLAANQNQTQRRNDTLQLILQHMVCKDLHTEVIIMGDLNYRIDMDMTEYNRLIYERENSQHEIHYMTMLGRDQLRNQTRLQNTFLLRFEEGVIEFPPSYKIGVENNVYNRERIPGWTDRIFSRKSKMKRVSYKCGTNIFGSDHRPIIAEFEKQSEFYMTEIRNEIKFGSKCLLI